LAINQHNTGIMPLHAQCQTTIAENGAPKITKEKRYQQVTQLDVSHPIFIMLYWILQHNTCGMLFEQYMWNVV
jgi:hypothetical protein